MSSALSEVASLGFHTGVLGGFYAVKVPDILSCDSSEEWRSFRDMAAAAAAGGAFAKDADLEMRAAALQAKYWPWVCPGDCSSGSDLAHDYVRELHRQCRDSNNFERYLVRHYFTNTKREFAPLPEASGFCLNGYITALVVLAWHALPDRIDEALRHLYVAWHMLGHYHSFDFLEGSSWPVSSLLILLNLQKIGDTFLPFLEVPEYGHPGQFGTGWYYDQLRWAGTTEEGKPRGLTELRPPFSPAPERPRVVVWQFCIHTSTAGEAVTMISRFLSQEFDVEFRGNSVAGAICNNYRPSLCAPARTHDFLTTLAQQFTESELPYPLLLASFTAELLGDLLQADVWMCSIPAVWCRLLADVNQQLGPEHKRKPIFAYFGLPILQYVPRADRVIFLQSIRDLILDDRNVVVANNAYLVEQVLWQIGLRVPTLRIHGLHTNATYYPSRNREVLVSRPGTSGGWQECLFKRFGDENPEYPIAFVQFTDLLDPHTTKEVYNTSLSYESLGQFRAIVSFPYDTSLMFFWEFYSMNMPIFVPFQLWRWGIFGQHTRPDLEQPTLGSEDGLPGSPFFSGFAPLELERAIYWSKFTDWAMFPHVQYFSHLAELMEMLVIVDLPALSASMKRFNEECLVRSIEAWRFVVRSWMVTAAPRASGA